VTKADVEAVTRGGRRKARQAFHSLRLAGGNHDHT
jgi:hypothetical protein